MFVEAMARRSYEYCWDAMDPFSPHQRDIPRHMRVYLEALQSWVQIGIPYTGCFSQGVASLTSNQLTTRRGTRCQAELDKGWWNRIFTCNHKHLRRGTKRVCILEVLC
ncbi:hypothetical protein Pcinc_023032 [Petrolisthes cinctipes]|uniref:Uncharacterized protein n=1 Tax=Petrolisthes cinctipes TaxID=88211 RepID=A0AAE1FDY1_PETCI|nr:hypothetical protein Pcinc_023032 [Petrolisthes cinctipes]